MSIAAGTDLRRLKEHPFDLLLELEKRSKAALAGSIDDDVNVEEWVGIGFRLGDEQFIVARDEIREILIVPEAVTRVPGTKPWVYGLANVRGHLLPVVSLKVFLGAGPKAIDRNTRILVVNNDEVPAGLIVDEVFGFRRFLDREHLPQTPQTIVRCERYLDGVYRRGDETWPVFSMDRLLRSEDFQRAAE